MLSALNLPRLSLKIALAGMMLVSALYGRCRGAEDGDDDHHDLCRGKSQDRAWMVRRAYEKSTGNKIVVSYAASSALAKQIEQGAPADIFISADLDWMNYVDKAKLIKDDTRFNLLGNRLVLIAPQVEHGVPENRAGI